MKFDDTKWLLLVVISAIVGLGIILYVVPIRIEKKQGSSMIVNSFDECVAAGFPVQESYPPRCMAEDGRSFTQAVEDERKQTEVMRVIEPRSNEVITSTYTVKGEARGLWYFEGSFPIELHDDSGAVIASASAKSHGEWMTEQFVPFTAEITFDLPISDMGLLILKNGNPSGMAENAAELIIPVRFR